MWDKLLGLLKDTYSGDENYVAPSIAKREARRQELASQVSEPQQEVKPSEGNGTLIGFNYLKGMNDKDNAERTRRFINLTKLLSGKYQNGKIEATSREPEEDIRREDT